MVYACSKENENEEQMNTESNRKKLSLQLCAPYSPEHVLFTVPQKQSWRKKCLFHSLGQSGPSALHTQPEATVLQDTLSRGALHTQWWSKLWDIVSGRNLTMILNLNLRQDFWSKIISLSQMTFFITNKIPAWFNGLEVFDATVQSNWS